MGAFMVSSCEMFLIDDSRGVMTNHESVLAQNKKAQHDYVIHENLEAGIVLQGSEVKSLRARKVSLSEAFVVEKDGELFLHNAHISPYDPAAQFGHEPRRLRKLLVHKREIRRLIGKVARRGFTLIPLRIYLNPKGIVKVSIALASGREKADKRHVIKEKEWNREKQRIFKKTTRDS